MAQSLFKEFKLDRKTQRQVNSLRKELMKGKNSWMWIAGVIGVGVVAYLVLANKDLTSPPFPIVDPLIDEIGDITGLEGDYPEGLPDLPFPIDIDGGNDAAKESASMYAAYEAEALASELSDQITVA